MKKQKNKDFLKFAELYFGLLILISLIVWIGDSVTIGFIGIFVFPTILLAIIYRIKMYNILISYGSFFLGYILIHFLEKWKYEGISYTSPLEVEVSAYDVRALFSLDAPGFFSAITFIFTVVFFGMKIWEKHRERSK